MRKVVMGLLLGAAMVGMPAVAQRWQERTPDGGDPAQARDDRQQARENRENDRDRQRPQQAERPQPAPTEARGDGRDRVVAPPAQEQGGARRDQPGARPNQYGRSDRPSGVDGAAGAVPPRDWRRDQARNGEGGRDRQPGRGDPRFGQRDGREDRRDWRNDDDRRAYRGDGGFDRGRGGYDNRHGDRGGGWDRGWRQDRRYDWQGYRQGNRNLFRAPRYYAPRGYAGGYRRWSPGFRLQPYFYAQSYWISDPSLYRLPPADGPYRWVRYYGDVLLIDLRSGEVVDAIHDFFW